MSTPMSEADKKRRNEIYNRWQGLIKQMVTSGYRGNLIPYNIGKEARGPFIEKLSRMYWRTLTLGLMVGINILGTHSGQFPHENVYSDPEDRKEFGYGKDVYTKAEEALKQKKVKPSFQNMSAQTLENFDAVVKELQGNLNNLKQQAQGASRHAEDMEHLAGLDTARKQQPPVKSGQKPKAEKSILHAMAQDQKGPREKEMDTFIQQSKTAVHMALLGKIGGWFKSAFIKDMDPEGEFYFSKYSFGEGLVMRLSACKHLLPLTDDEREDIVNNLMKATDLPEALQKQPDKERSNLETQLREYFTIGLKRAEERARKLQSQQKLGIKPTK